MWKHTDWQSLDFSQHSANSDDYKLKKKKKQLRTLALFGTLWLRIGYDWSWFQMLVLFVLIKVSQSVSQSVSQNVSNQAPGYSDGNISTRTLRCSSIEAIPKRFTCLTFISNVVECFDAKRWHRLWHHQYKIAKVNLNLHQFASRWQTYCRLIVAVSVLFFSLCPNPMCDNRKWSG